VIDIVEQINAVRRQVGSRTLEAGQARVVTIGQQYDAEIADVWDALTNPDRIPRWFLPISGDLRPGGSYQLEGNASGKIERCDPPNSFAATWEAGGVVSWIEVRLTAEPGGGTRFELDHINPEDEKWAEFGPGAVGVGWDLALVGLTRHLATGASVPPGDGLAWLGSAEGRQFVARSSERWGAANVAAGSDRAAADAATERTTAAYTLPG
jgi:uncharacterized protein YndB with AHSA1/START domain